MSSPTELYKIPPLSKEFVALEALSVVVKKHVDGEVPKEHVLNSLQEYRKDVDSSMTDLVRIDTKLAGEYLDTAMTNKYRQRISDLSGVLLASSASLAFMANRGDFDIISNAQSPLDRKKISAYDGEVPVYQDCLNFLKSVRLFTASLKIIQSYTNINFFKEEKDVENIFGKTVDLFKSFKSDFGDLTVKTNDSTSSFELGFDKHSIRTVKGFEKAGWTLDRLLEYRTAFSGSMVVLSKIIFQAAQAINRFNMMITVARSLAYFSIYVESLAAALNRLPWVFLAPYINPWSNFMVEMKG